MDTLQQALNRTVERHNMARFTPARHARDLAAVTMRLTAKAIAGGDTKLAGRILQARRSIPGQFRGHRRRLHRLALGLSTSGYPGTTPVHQTGWLRACLRT